MNVIFNPDVVLRKLGDQKYLRVTLPGERSNAVNV